MDRHLHILWTNSNINTSRQMVLLYSRNSMLNDWWDNVTVIIWGDPARLAVEDESIINDIKLCQSVGVKFIACIACASSLGTVEKLETLGVEVKRTGAYTTELIQNGKPLITI